MCLFVCFAYNGGDYLVDDELAVAGQEVPALMELLDLLMVVHVLVRVVDEHVLLSGEKNINKCSKERLTFM